MRFPRIDASIVCFGIVVIAAVPVATLRSRTYSLGYELGQLKQQERLRHQKNIELQSELANVQRMVRDKYLSKIPTTPKKNEILELDLPGTDSVIHEGAKQRH